MRATPQPPGRTPHRSAARLLGGEALLAPGATPRNPPGASGPAGLRASGTTKQAAVLRTPGTTSREGGNEMTMSGGQRIAWPGVLLRAGAGCLGAGMIILPAPELPGRGWLLTLAGLLLGAACLAGPPARWRAVGTLAAAAAVLECALARPGLTVLAVEGVLILGYLLLVDAPLWMPRAVAARWLRLQLPAAFWGTLTAAVLLVVLAVPVPVSAWLLVAGAGAAVAATFIALPRRPGQPRQPR